MIRHTTTMISRPSDMFIFSSSPIDEELECAPAPSLKPMLAKKYEGQNVEGWLMSEKLDGVRAIWTGSQLLSREGNSFNAPTWFISQLPSGIALDGELFIARQRFQETVGIIRKSTPIDAEWCQIRYCVFDSPQTKGSFDKRLKCCESLLQKSTVACVLAHVPCLNHQHLDSFFQTMIESGAEGIILRSPLSRYVNGRSEKMLKLKPFDSDEATVISYNEGHGRLSGMIGSLTVNWRGIVFDIGSGLTDSIRKNPPAIGQPVTFVYSGTTSSGTPRCASFLVERSYE